MLNKLFTSLANFIIRAYRGILLTAIAMTVVSLVLITRLHIDFSLDSLLPSQDERVRELLGDLQDSGTQDVLVALVTVASPDRLDDGKSVVDEFAGKMARVPSIKSIEARIAVQHQRFFTKVLMPNAAMFLSDKDRGDLLDRLGDANIRRQIQENKRLLLMPMQGGAGELIVRDPLGLRKLWLSHWLSTQVFSGLEVSDGYLVDKEHRRLLVFVRPEQSARNINFTKQLMASARSAADDAVETWRESHPGGGGSPRITFAGGYPIALEDEALTRKDLQVTLLVSLIGVNLLFYLVFRSVRILILMLIPLAMGIIWTFGSLWFIFDHVSILTGTFGGVLMGLTTDFAVYFLSYYLAVCRSSDQPNALRSALVKSGRAIAMGGLTAAAAFFTLGASSFRGFRELGAITGMGLIFCLLSMLVVLPALLVWQARRGWAPYQVRPISHFYLDHLFRAVKDHPRGTIVGCLVILILLSASAFRVSFNDDLRSLRPQQESNMSAQKQLESILGGATSYLLLVMEDESESALLDRALRLNSALDRLQQEGRLSHYRSVLSYLPAPESRQQARLFFQNHASELDPARIEASFKQALQENGFQYLPEYDSYLKWLRTLLQPSGELSRQDYEESGTSSLIAPFLVQHGSRHKLLTYVYPKAGLWMKGDLQRFTGDVSQSAAAFGIGATQWRLSGFPAMSNYLKETVWNDLGKTVLLASLAIIFLVLLAFRHPLPAALSLIPSLAAMISILGLMALLSMRFNYINFIVLPLMIGICIDDGVLIINHRDQEPELPLTAALEQIGPAVVLTSLTTLMGFGSLVCSSYPGLRSIGWVAGVGILAELSASLVLLPAVLALLERRPRSRRFASDASRIECNNQEVRV